MNPERDTSDSQTLPLKGIKIRRPFFGKNPVSELVPVRNGGMDPESTPSAFQIHLNAPELKIAVSVHAEPDGRLQARAHCFDPALLNRAAVPVGLGGAMTDETIGRSIVLKVPEPDGCSGTADFGPLVDVVKRLGPQLRIIAFLALDPSETS